MTQDIILNNQVMVALSIPLMLKATHPIFSPSHIHPSPAIRRCVCATVETEQSTRRIHSLFDQNTATKCMNSWHCFLQNVQPANFPVIRCGEWRKRLCDKLSLTLIKRWRKVSTVHGPRGYFSTGCLQGILAEKHKERSGRSTQETPHVFVKEQKKPWHTCYSIPKSYIPALWMTSLRSIM